MNKLVLLLIILSLSTSTFAQNDDIRIHARIDTTKIINTERCFDTIGQYIICLDKDFTYFYRGVLNVYDTIKHISKKTSIPINYSESIISKENPIQVTDNKWIFSFIITDASRSAGIIIVPKEDDIKSNRALKYLFSSSDFGSTWQIQVMMVEL